MGIGMKPAKSDWPKYNNALVNRGHLTILVDKNFAETWHVKYDEDTARTRGGQAKYTEEAIKSLLSLRFVFRQPLRSMEGFAKSLVAMMNLNIDVPDYTTLSLGMKKLKIKLPSIHKDSGGGYVASIDSTGLKIHGQGEWNRKKHSQKDRREWVKMHLIVDNESMQIIGVEATADDVHDCEIFDKLVDTLPETTHKVLGDGAYDTLAAYKKAVDKGIELVALPRDNAAIDLKSTEEYVLKRNEHVKKYKADGLHAWAKKNDYWERNRSETTMSRFITTFSGTLSSRKVESQKNEILLKCGILNLFADITTARDNCI
jgi:Transposase DDE domain